MYLEIITPEQTLFKGEVDSVLFPGSLGDFQVLNNHAPIVSTLKKGEVKIIGKLNLDSSVKDQFEISDKETILKIESGTVEMNNCLLYTSPSPRDRYGSRMPSSA